MKALVFASFLLTGPVFSFDLPEQSAIQAYSCPNCYKLSHENLSLSWAIEDKVLAHETLHEQSSRKYQLDVNLQQLRKGLSIHTEAAGALIRISPVNPANKLQTEFFIKNTNGPTLSLLKASSLFSKDEALAETAFAENTLLVAQLKKELGSGDFVISIPEDAKIQMDEQSEFIVQIYDSNSNSELNISTDKANYRYGEELTTIIRLRGKKNLNYSIDTILVTLIDPFGKKTVLNARALDENTYAAKYKLLSNQNSNGENWHIDAKVTGSRGKRTISRHTHTAFSYMIPSATLKELSRTEADSLNFSATIEVATESRYALQAVLFGSDLQGSLHPIQTTQTAAWLTTGLNTLNFSFDSNLKSDYKAPYYIGYLRLTDFGQLEPVFVYDNPIDLSKLG